MSYTAVVTGAAGFVGTQLVKQLLERGWTVRATARDVSDARRMGPLERLAAALPGALELHEADLMSQGSFHAVCAGAHYVFHCASPFEFPEATEAQAQMVTVAVEGTRNVLTACAAAGRTLRRVVMTSSVAGARPAVEPWWHRASCTWTS